jgi:hypothetical protein
VIARNAEEADVLAKVLALRPERLDELGVPAVVRYADRVCATAAWAVQRQLAAAPLGR